MTEGLANSIGRVATGQKLYPAEELGRGVCSMRNAILKRQIFLKMGKALQGGLCFAGVTSPSLYSSILRMISCHQKKRYLVIPSQWILSGSRNYLVKALRSVPPLLREADTLASGQEEGGKQLSVREGGYFSGKWGVAQTSWERGVPPEALFKS